MSQVQIQLQKVPFYQGAIDCVEMGIESSLQVSNVRLRRAVKSQEQVTAMVGHGGPPEATKICLTPGKWDVFFHLFNAWFPN